MDERDLKDEIDKFAADNVAVLYGGDGTLVGEWRKFHARKGGKLLLPVRNYGLCQKHIDFYHKVFTGAEDAPQLKQFLFPVLRGGFKDKGVDNCLDALAELTVVSADQTVALRFNVKINGKPVIENAIANGAVIATKLGSTGYFKSVARTIFTQGIGIGLIAPTYSVPNLVVGQSDNVTFELARRADIVVTADKLKQEIHADAGWILSIADACSNVAVFGYDWFMCPECRKNRNSTIVNDSYCIV